MNHPDRLALSRTLTATKPRLSWRSRLCIALALALAAWFVLVAAIYLVIERFLTGNPLAMVSG